MSGGPLPEFYPELVAKIRARLVPDPDRPGCLVYPTKPGKHARVKFDGRLYSPHRVMLEAKLGRLLPRHIDACHECDNPPCCLDDHLWEGTRSQNVRDAVIKGLVKTPVWTPELKAKRAATLRARARPWGMMPLRQCESLSGFRCDACPAPIVLGDMYYDRGHQVRAHARCVAPTPSHNREALR